jgi:hypothetical protein
MNVVAQFILADLDKSGSMFDFQVMFFIVNPRASWIEAFYIFDKNSTKKEIKESERISSKNLTKQMQLFKGDLDNGAANDSKPFAYDDMTGTGIGKNVDAQVELESFNKSRFTISVSLVKKKSNSVKLTFEGEKPSWLPDDGKAIFNGKLILSDVKDLSPKKP